MIKRLAIEICGIVQGVGFRPFVYHLALRHRLCGFVRNRAGRIEIEIEGELRLLDLFLAGLTEDPPPLSHIEELSWEERATQGDNDFRIEASDIGFSSHIFISPDVATCRECLAELFDPTDRHYRYPFLNCTNCGPRLTIVTGGPYDRAQTTMASFPMCSDCRAEYEDPGNRRFHAQPIACPACGPRVSVRDGPGNHVTTDDEVTYFAQALLLGKIGALKGLGGYQLVCDARNENAVAELRRRKLRDEKPFAIMVADIAAAMTLCQVDEQEEKLLRSPHAPIVLLRKRAESILANQIEPGNPYLGVMVPYTPLHHLLLRAAGGIPLVMTSGNRSDEPIVVRDDAIEKLAGIADLYLTHNRPIHVRCDDSVTRVIDGTEMLVRRSRGYAPKPIALPFNCPRPILALGGQLKSTFAIAQGRDVFLSHHLGDLDNLDAFRAYESDIQLYEQLFALKPELLAHDLHPDYRSTHYALDRSARTGTPLQAIQHHHAHMASCTAENGLMGSAIGVIFDGTGYGTDGTIWGGEFLVGGYGEFRRVGHLRHIAMPDSEKAVQQPWRMALAYLIDSECDGVFQQCGVSRSDERIVRTMLQRGFNSPSTSSAGRLFDAVAASLAVRTVNSYD